MENRLREYMDNLFGEIPPHQTGSGAERRDSSEPHRQIP